MYVSNVLLFFLLRSPASKLYEVLVLQNLGWFLEMSYHFPYASYLGDLSTMEGVEENDLNPS